jgi:uncharacterized protein (TIGR02246 family)
MTSPETVSAALGEALTRGDVKAARNCFTRDGCLVTPDDTAVHGRDEIGHVLEQLAASSIEVRIEKMAMVATSEAALSHERWTIVFREGRPEPYIRSFVATLLMRPVEGHWKLAIAAPWGWPGGDPQLVASPSASSGKAIITPR